MHLSQKFYETYEAILLCVWVFFPFISPWKSSAFFHVLYTSYALITLKMKMSVWVRAVCIWNVHMHAFVHVLTVRMFVCTRKSDKKSNLETTTKKTRCYGNAVSRHMREWLCIWFLFMFTLEMITSVTWMK